MRTSISLRMWLVDYMAWDNLMLEVIDPVTHAMAIMFYKQKKQFLKRIHLMFLQRISQIVLY